MDNEILLMVAKSGVFAVLFVILLFYVLRDSRNREQNYQKVVNVLTKERGAVMNIEDDIKDIKNTITLQPLYNAEVTYEGEI